MKLRAHYQLLLSVAFLVLLSASTHGAAHSWRINEIFSNADGTIQFIELQEQEGFDNEHQFNGKSVICLTLIWVIRPTRISEIARTADSDSDPQD